MPTTRKVLRYAIVALRALVLNGRTDISRAQQTSATPQSNANATTDPQPKIKESHVGDNATSVAPNPASAEPAIVRGEVVDPNGRPARGAEVWAEYRGQSGTRRLAATRADEAGLFQLVFAKPHVAVDIVTMGDPSIWTSNTVVAATQPGFGAAASNWEDLETTKPLQLRLVPDCPIEGRLLDLDGQPVQGATIEALSIAGSKDHLKQWLDLSRTGSNASRGLTHFIPPTVVAPATTDASGRFRLVGIGRERVLQLAFRGLSIAYSDLTVVTKEIPQLEEEVPGSEPKRMRPVPRTDVHVQSATDASDRWHSSRCLQS